MDTPSIIRTSLWLRPAGDALDRIRNAIRRAHEHDGGLPVDPHVTLLSGFETTETDGCAKLRQLARLRPFTIRLGRVEGTADYYRAFYAVVEPSAELAAARHAAAEAFGFEPQPSFEPHLSLLYGNFGEARREALAGVLGGRLAVSFTAGAVDLVNAARSVPVTSWRTLCTQSLAEQ